MTLNLKNKEAIPQYNALKKMVKYKIEEEKQTRNEKRINDADPKQSWRVA